VSGVRRVTPEEFERLCAATPGLREAVETMARWVADNAAVLAAHGPRVLEGIAAVDRALGLDAASRVPAPRSAQ
jgi:hypothetical protein